MIWGPPSHHFASDIEIPSAFWGPQKTRTYLFVNIGRWTLTSIDQNSMGVETVESEHNNAEVVSMAKEGAKDVKVEEDAAKAK